ncbi:DUF4331 family protein [Tenacibaculum sp. TC6]|uniref:DUF4331 family protein n=1 Tax=Tenacibaculum sp. TC6 TaxID=3423223 RepID=UPI003D36975F
MKKTKHLGKAFILAAFVGLLIAADHIDAPDVASSYSDITDYYAFQGEDTNNIVFVANVKGLMSPSETASASFDENVLIEFNIDTDGDYIEDLVIQATPRDGQMYFFGPYQPATTGLNSTINTGAPTATATITPYGKEPLITTSNGMMFFAGPRDDPFFMDFARYGEIISGKASGFNNPGSDTFAGTNVLSIVVEVPKNKIGSTGTINTWVESKTKS